MTFLHRLILLLSWTVILAELWHLIYYRQVVIDWVSHNLWVVIIPFAKTILKRLIAINLIGFAKALSILLWHLSKLLILKLFKTIGLRYGVFFSQNRWYWIRHSRVMFVRRGKQFFRRVRWFWSAYLRRHKWVILIAFFPVGLLVFLLGLSFDLTRKTMVQKTQETAIFKMATSASQTSRGIRAWISRLDQWTIVKIQQLSPKRQAVQKDSLSPQSPEMVQGDASLKPTTGEKK